MSSRDALLALVLLLAPPLAGAHGAASAYDPLVVEMHAFLTADGALAEAAPDAGEMAFPPSDPLEPGEPLVFALDAPVRFEPAGGLVVTLRLRAAQPVVARDADGNAFELSLLRDGAPVEGASRRVPLADPVLAPDARATLDAVVQAPGVVFEERSRLALQVRPLMPLAEGALLLLVGPEGSRADLPDMRVPRVADLKLQDAPLVEFVTENETFEPPEGSVATVVRVRHDRVEAPRAMLIGSPTYLVLVGEEGEEEARSHSFPDRPRRLAAAHELLVGDRLVRVHPGLGVVVPLTRTADVTCARNCPPDFRFSVPVQEAPRNGSVPSQEPTGVLIPPPRSTAGIPVSQDAPPEDGRGVPGPALAATLAAALLAARRKPKA